MSRKFTAFAWGVLLWNAAIVLWGAYVRATGAGAGCGNHWPLCNGTVLPQAAGVKTLIEFTHRAMTGLDGFLVIALVIWAFRIFPPQHAVRTAAKMSGVFLIVESLLGAALVKLEHVAANSSPYRAFSLSAHLISTLSLLAFIALTAWWSSGRPAIRPRGRDAWMAGGTLGVVVVLGITGVIAALGDTLFPARTLAEGFARDFDPAAHFFVRLRVWHPAIAAIAGMWILFYATRRLRSSPQLAGMVLAALIAQILAGVCNLLLAAPVWLQLVHLLLADTLWISLVLLTTSGHPRESKVLTELRRSVAM